MEPKEGNVEETSGSQNACTGLLRIAELAKKAPKMVFTTLGHHLTHELLSEAYRRTRKDGALGVDGVTGQQYAQELEKNLRALLERAKSGTYQAPPVRRVYIPKGSGAELRPIGIPTLEDKILQRAVAMILEAVYEQDFLPFSMGFRPGKSAHQATEMLRSAGMSMYGGWVVEVDIRQFFDSVDHCHLREILSQRVRDGVILRLIGKWLKAGVWEDGALHRSESGTPQGGVISPLLANIYLHTVVDQWWANEIVPRLKGHGAIVRYADDMVMLFEHKKDAEKMLAVLPLRFGRYGLKLHPEKTRLVPFEGPDKERRPPENGPPTSPGTFDFLGFTHYWGRSRAGRPVIKVKTAASRLRRTLKRASDWLRRHRHDPVKEQHRSLSQALRGHYGYFGVTGNAPMLNRLRHALRRLWRKWLSRRSRTAKMNWTRFAQLEVRYKLPDVRIVHSVYSAANP